MNAPGFSGSVAGNGSSLLFPSPAQFTFNQPELNSDFSSFASSSQNHHYNLNHTGPHVAQYNQELAFLSKATRDMLFQSGNSAYMQIYSKMEVLERENITLKADLAANKTLVAFLTENRTQTAQSSHVLGGPAILSTSLAPLPALNKADYANVRFWTKSSYTEYEKKYKGDTNALATRKRRRGRQLKGNNEPGTDIVTRYSFLEDIDGNLVPADRLNLISIKSRQCWFSLLRTGHAPAKWRAKDDAASAYYRREMESEFIEFRFGADGWKLEKYASLNYSSWYNNHVKSKVANSDSNDDEEELKADDEEEPKDDDDEDSDPETTRKPQKQHRQSSPTLDETDLFCMTPPPSEEPPSSPDLPSFYDPLSNIYDDIDQIIETPAERPSPLDPPPQPCAPPQEPYNNEVPDGPESPITRPTSPETDELIDDIDTDLVAMEAATATSIKATKTSTIEKKKPRPRGPKVAMLRANCITARNECMADWLETHAGGLEEDFNKHFATLSKPQKKIYDARAKMKKNGPGPATIFCERGARQDLLRYKDNFRGCDGSVTNNGRGVIFSLYLFYLEHVAWIAWKKEQIVPPTQYQVFTLGATKLRK
ncbi:uncharacterized protein ARMOST_11477 [Armillaria ostoyae]|uniref:Uncharacterized protein n=1 Tax=Armillaria ostoyae TaxID=47428 RepID=A0A284RH84_ARMOS|nr:uncharacterized protein ARMOST_11477 [Armillaria ostoyae]